MENKKDPRRKPDMEINTHGPTEPANVGRDNARTVLKRRMNELEDRLEQLVVLDKAIHWENLSKDQERRLWELMIRFH